MSEISAADKERKQFIDRINIVMPEFSSMMQQKESAMAKGEIADQLKENIKRAEKSRIRRDFRRKVITEIRRALYPFPE